MFFIRNFLCIAFFGIQILALAQPNDGGSFKTKQQEMLTLMANQKPILNKLTTNMEEYRQKLDHWIDILKYPSKIRDNKTAATQSIVAVRKYNDTAFSQFKELTAAWFHYNLHLMAVYTRYGEQKERGKVDAELTEFLKEHRSHLALMDSVYTKVQDIFSDCDFLLNSKLN